MALCSKAKKCDPILAIVGGFFAGCLVGIGAFVLGGIFLFIPIIGLLIGPAFMLAGLACPFMLPFMFLGEYSGPCPQCGKTVAMFGKDFCTCRRCKSRVVRDGNIFTCY